MPLSISKSALDRLGRRMVQAELVDDTDMEEFEAVAQAYQDCLDQVERQLAYLGFDGTTRVKTTTTLLEKLRRESARLSQVHDLAGARIIVEDRNAQDRAVGAIRTSFDGAGAASKIVDRRAKPSHGYRAVHVIVQVDSIPIEIQVRTALQDAWAQLMERLADEWGREIRYGGDPRDPDALLARGWLTRRQAVAYVIELGDWLADHEESQAKVERIESRMARMRAATSLLEKAAQSHRGVAGQARALSDQSLLHSLLELGFTVEQPIDTIRDSTAFPSLVAGLTTALRAAEEQLATVSQDMAESEEALRGMLEAVAFAASDQEQLS